MKDFSYFMPTRLVQGAGCLAQLGEYCEPLGSKALVVTGRTSARKCGALDSALAQLPDPEVFDAVEENPSTDTCEQGAAYCRQQGCDVVVAIGGGSPMDAAKAIAVLARNDGRCDQYFGKDKYPRENLPIIAVPTTAGTGSEVTPYAVLTDSRENMKRTLAGTGLFPRVAMLDPELSVSMPRSVTVNTGLDALSQAMEGMLSRHSTPLGDALALEACRLVRRWLPRAAENGTDLEARAQMLYAACLTGCIIAQSGTTLVHGMGYYLTIEFGLAHGLANALLLPAVFHYNAHYEPRKVAQLAETLGYPAEAVPEAAGQAVAAAVYSLLHELDVSPAAREAGVDRDRVLWCADQIVQDRSRFKNQAGEPALDDVRGFFLSAWEGQLRATV